MAKSQSQPDLLESLKRLGERKEAKVLVPTTFLAIAVLDAIPTPADVGYFYTEKYLEDHKDAIKHYWGAKALNYYGWDILWYLTLFGLTYKVGQTALDKIKVGAAVISTGAIISLLWRFTQKQQQAIEAPVEEMTGLAGLELIA